MTLKSKNINKVRLKKFILRISSEKNNVFLISEVLKAREDIETLREQYESTIKEYDNLKSDHQKLQV